MMRHAPSVAFFASGTVSCAVPKRLVVSCFFTTSLPVGSNTRSDAFLPVTGTDGPPSRERRNSLRPAVSPGL